jgi:hypothetical protein
MFMTHCCRNDIGITCVLAYFIFIQVLASYGHIRDLPNKAGAVLPDQDFAMTWAFNANAQPRCGCECSIITRAHAICIASARFNCQCPRVWALRDASAVGLMCTTCARLQPAPS